MFLNFMPWNYTDAVKEEINLDILHPLSGGASKRGSCCKMYCLLKKNYISNEPAKKFTFQKILIASSVIQCSPHSDWIHESSHMLKYHRAITVMLTPIINSGKLWSNKCFTNDLLYFSKLLSYARMAPLLLWTTVELIPLYNPSFSG